MYVLGSEQGGQGTARRWHSPGGCKPRAWPSAFILPTARDVTDSNYSPLLIVHKLLGAVWAQQAGHMSPLARRSSSSAVTALPLQIPLVLASRPASGPGWPWGSLSPLGITVPFGRPPLPLGTSQLCQLLPKEPCAVLAKAPHRQREGRGC